MDLYVIPLAVVLLVVPLISLLMICVTSRKLLQPPGSKGWPILGENVEFVVLGPLKFIKGRMKKYSSEVFQTSLMGERVAVVCGAQGNKFMFANDTKLFNTWWPKSAHEVVFDLDVRGYSQVEAFLHRLKLKHHDILMPEALRRYIPAMHHVAARHMDIHWRNSTSANDDEIKLQLVPLIKKYTFEVASRLFMSDSLHLDLFDAFSLMVNGMLSMPIRFPGTAYSRALSGGRIVHRELIRIIKERRKETKGTHDVLSKMMLDTDENGEFLSVTDIANNVNVLLVGLFETTSSTIATLMNNLAHHPHVYQQVLKEQTEIAGSKGQNEVLTWEDIQTMKYSWNVVSETLRLAPVPLGPLKEVTTEFTYAGFTIPTGWKAAWTAFSSHMNPKYFPEPDKFDPSRFAGRGPAPYTFVPFGGGPQICPGRELARILILVFLHNVVIRFKFEKVIPSEKIVYYTFPTPANGLPLHLHPHKK